MTENIDVSPLYNAIYGDGHFEQVRLGSLINKGGAAGNHIDIFFDTHGETRMYGTQSADVYLLS